MRLQKSSTVKRLGIGLTAATLLITTACAAKVNETSSSTAAAPVTSAAAPAGSVAPASSAAGAAAGSAPASAAPAPSSGVAASGAAAPAKMLPVTGTCSTPINMAMNAWVGYTADAAVVTYVLENSLKCKVNQKALAEELAWQGLPTGQIDVIMENWGHADLTKKYIDQQKTAVDAGLTGNLGQIGWYVTPSTLKMFPDITNWKNLNKYATKFQTSESGGKGQLLDGDPSFVTNEAALVKNLDLDYKVVYAGSEAALIQAFRTGQQNNTPVLGYFYSPQWFLAEIPLTKINLPKWTPGCDTDPKKVACDYPNYNLNKIMSSKLANSGSPAVNLIKNFNWTNDDQNLVAKYITADKMTPEAAAKKWVDANPDKVNAWLGK
jgi:glycine betaine/proline transport system substrate-binding protein